MVTYQRTGRVRAARRGPLAGLVLLLVAAAALWLVLRGGDDPAAVGPLAPSAESADLPGARPAPQGDAPWSIVLLRSDMATPSPGRRLTVHRYTPRRMERPTFVQELTTDDQGVARATALEPGSYIISAPGAGPSSPEPATARATLAPDGPPVTCYLVEPEPTTAVTFNLQAAFTPRSGLEIRLICRRRGDGERFRSSRPIAPGASALEIALPAGRYDLEVEPLGELIVQPEHRSLQVEGSDQEARVSLVENPARIDVQLRGLPPSELPVRVYPQPIERVLVDRPQQEWWGPMRWSTAQALVPALPDRRHLLVFSRDDVFRSREPIELDGDRITVDLLPATRIVVDWFGWDPQRDGGALLSVEVGDDWAARTLRPRFGDGRRDRPALGGELVIARGSRAKLVCTRDDESIAWQRDVVADAAVVEVRIESQVAAESPRKPR